MKKIKFVLIVILGVAMTTIACKKDDGSGDDNNGGGDNNSTKCYVNKVDNGDSYSTIGYNADHMVSVITSYDSLGNQKNKIMFTYESGKQKLIEIYDDNNMVAKYEFHYPASSTAPDTAYIFADTLGNGGNLSKVGAMVMAYNNGKLVSVTEKYSMAGMSIDMSKSEFTYNGDNISTIKNYQLDYGTFQLKLHSTTSYQYDDKNGIAYGIGLEYFAALMGDNIASKNNPIKEIYQDENGTQDDQHSYNYTYEYSNENYPVKQTDVSFDNSSTDVTLYTYDCSK